MIILRYKEDLMLFSGWFKELIELHFGLSKLGIYVKTHVVDIFGNETDLVIEGQGKRVLVELKESDLKKALAQVLARRELYDYAYVALNLSAKTLMSMARNFAEVFKLGIGLISAKSDCILIRSYKQHLNESIRYIDVLKVLK